MIIDQATIHGKWLFIELEGTRLALIRLDTIEAYAYDTETKVVTIHTRSHIWELTAPPQEHFTDWQTYQLDELLFDTLVAYDTCEQEAH